jgi:phage head maturation protease
MPQSVNEDARTADLVFTTGALVRRWDWSEGEYEEELLVSEASMRMDRLRGGANLLADHNAWDIDDVLGVVERAWVQDGKGYATVRFARDEDTEVVWQKVKDGILRNVSVGYIVHAYQEIKEGARRVLRAIDWEPMEISIVAVPADAGSQVRSSEKTISAQCILHRAQPSTTKEDSMNDSIEGAQDTVPANDGAEAPAAEQPVVDAPAPEQAPAAEVRSIEIMELCALSKQPLERAIEFLKSGKTVAEVRAALMESRDAKIAGEKEISSHITPPAEQKTGGTATRMQQRFAEGAGGPKAKSAMQLMQRRFSA